MTWIPRIRLYAIQQQAGKMLENLLKTNQDHPGIAHYLIHAYDYPELASQALDAARRYDDIAPWVPHALHIPSHIYTRMGMWKESILGNIASSLAARDYAKRFYHSATTMDDLHALDYLMFAYLQTAQDSKAAGVLRYLERIEQVVPGSGFVSAYAIAAIPARYYLERGDWQEAAKLKLLQPKLVGRFPFPVAHGEFARAVGAARSGNIKLAEASVEQLKALRDSVNDPKFQWWIGQIEIQHLSACGWLAHARNQEAVSEALFRDAVKIEGKAGTHPVTPGQILPAREQLAEMLLEAGKAEAALTEFERSLEAFPRRLRSHLGAVQAATQIGRSKTARKHAEQLIQMAGEFGERTEVLETARLILSGSQGTN